MHSVRELGGVDDHYNLYRLISEFLKFKYNYTKFFIDKIYKWCYNFSIILNILGVNYGLHFKSRYFRNRNCY